MGISSAVDWIAQNGGNLSSVSLLLLGIAVLAYGFLSGKVIAGRQYRQVCDERDLERTGHDTARNALADTRVDLAEATTGAEWQQRRITELERALAHCEGQTSTWQSGLAPSSPPHPPRRKESTR